MYLGDSRSAGNLLHQRQGLRSAEGLRQGGPAARVRAQAGGLRISSSIPFSASPGPSSASSPPPAPPFPRGSERPGAKKDEKKVAEIRNNQMSYLSRLYNNGVKVRMSGLSSVDRRRRPLGRARVFPAAPAPPEVAVIVRTVYAPPIRRARAAWRRASPASRRRPSGSQHGDPHGSDRGGRLPEPLLSVRADGAHRRRDGGRPRGACPCAQRREAQAEPARGGVGSRQSPLQGSEVPGGDPRLSPVRSRTTREQAGLRDPDRRGLLQARDRHGREGSKRAATSTAPPPMARTSAMRPRTRPTPACARTRTTTWR